MIELRAGRPTGENEGLTTLHQVVRGYDRGRDTCVGMVATPALAHLIATAVNGEMPQVAEAVRAADQRLRDLQHEIDGRIEAARRIGARAERERILSALESLAVTALGSDVQAVAWASARKVITDG